MTPEAEARGEKRRLPLLHRVLLALVVGIVGLEVALRVVDWSADRDAAFFLPPGDHRLAVVETHPFMGYANRPGATREGNIAEGGQVFHINSLGLRGAELAREKPPGVYRILCLGGSTTFGSGASEDHKTYPARLEHYLNQMAPAGVRYEVANCGVNGYTTAENLIYLALELVELDPDAIVIYQAANDARPIQARGFEPDYSHMRRSWVVTELTPLERWLVGNVRLYAWATRGLEPQTQLGAQGNPVFVPGYQDLHQSSDQGVPDEGLAVFFRNLRHMVLIARDHGIQPVLSTFALCEAKEAGPERFVETIRTINQNLVPFCAENDVPLIDVAAALDEQCDLYTDMMHLNDAGSDRHGQVVADQAKQQGLFGL